MTQTTDTRKAIGARIKALRKQKKWTQKELAARLDIGLSQFNKYESGLHTPQVEKVIRLAELFDTTTDFLLTGDRADQKPLHNIKLLDRLQSLECFDNDDQETIIKIIDAMIMKKRMEGMVNDPFDKKKQNTGNRV
jgi:transcriptional regulator with XRE-family HTH domain